MNSNNNDEIHEIAVINTWTAALPILQSFID